MIGSPPDPASAAAVAGSTGAAPDAGAGDAAAPRTSPNKLAANLSALAASQAVTWTMSLLWTLIVPRLLGPAGLGMIVTASSTTAVIGILLGQGTKDFLVREIVSEPDEGPSLVGTALVLRACLIPLYVGAVALYAHFAHFTPQGTAVLYVIAGATLCTLLIEPLQASFQAIQRMEYLAFGDVFNKTAVSAVGVGLAALGFGALGLSVSTLIISALGVVLFAYWIRSHFRIDPHTSVRAMGMFIARSLPYWALGVFFMIYLWVDSMILALMARPEVVGWYGAAIKLFSTLFFAPAIIATAWLPRLVSSFKEGPDHFRAAARNPVELVLIMSLPIAAITALTAHSVIPLLFGPDYRPAVPVMVVLALCVPPMYVGIMLNQVLIAAKRPLVWTWLMGGATVVNSGLNIFLIRVFQHRSHNGAEGAAVALLITEVLICSAGMVIVGRNVLDQSSLSRFIRAAGATLGLVAVMYGLRPLGFVAATAAGVVVFVALALLFRVASHEEMAILRSAVTRLWSRDRSGRGTKHSS